MRRAVGELIGREVSTRHMAIVILKIPGVMDALQHPGVERHVLKTLIENTLLVVGSETARNCINEYAFNNDVVDVSFRHPHQRGISLFTNQRLFFKYFTDNEYPSCVQEFQVLSRIHHCWMGAHCPFVVKPIKVYQHLGRVADRRNALILPHIGQSAEDLVRFSPLLRSAPPHFYWTFVLSAACGILACHHARLCFGDIKCGNLCWSTDREDLAVLVDGGAALELTWPPQPLREWSAQYCMNFPRVACRKYDFVCLAAMAFFLGTGDEIPDTITGLRHALANCSPYVQSVVLACLRASDAFFLCVQIFNFAKTCVPLRKFLLQSQHLRDYARWFLRVFPEPVPSIIAEMLFGRAPRDIVPV